MITVAVRTFGAILARRFLSGSMITGTTSTFINRTGAILHHVIWGSASEAATGYTDEIVHTEYFVTYFQAVLDGIAFCECIRKL
jgi:hypothetical protein